MRHYGHFIAVVMCLAALFSCSTELAVRGTEQGRPTTSSLQGLFESSPRPAGVKIQLLPDEGPTFTDENGRTLYLWNSPQGGFCEDKVDPITDNLGPLMQSLASVTPTCAAQWPPLIVKADARPAGDWTILERPDGHRQWAYKGHPVHYSYKDRLAGDVNGVTATEPKNPFAPKPGYFIVAQPPLVTPPGIKVTVRRAAGMVATTVDGLIIYTGVTFERTTRNRKQPAIVGGNDSVDDSHRWRSLPVGALASAIGPWSIFVEPDGSRVWAYRGRPLYTYSDDHTPQDVSGYGIDGARPLILSPARKAPADILVRRSLVGPVFTGAKGMTLYTFQCANINPAGKDKSGGPAFFCDNWNDDPAFAETYCPAADRCAEMWRPLVAPANTKPQGGVWSTVVIPDPVRFPLRWVPLDGRAANTPGAVKVWTYRGHPVYESTRDQSPGQIRGHNVWNVFSSKWIAIIAGEPEHLT